jgi:hypothetical protein
VTARTDRLTQLEAGLLERIATLHPDRLTSAELVLLMKSERCDRLAVLDALAGLRRSGLARQSGDVVELTYAALCAHALLTR